MIALRQENGLVHEGLDASVYRLPDDEAVRRHFVELLATPDDRSAVLVLAEGPDVLGMVEVALSDAPPKHQVLLPTPGRGDDPGPRPNVTGLRAVPVMRLEP